LIIQDYSTKIEYQVWAVYYVNNETYFLCSDDIAKKLRPIKEANLIVKDGKLNGEFHYWSPKNGCAGVYHHSIINEEKLGFLIETNDIYSDWLESNK